jgi:type II secretory pathway predicted ATPase ExeA
MRFFNTAGPCRPDIHYMLPAAARLPESLRIIEQQGYFVIHAPRQTGKTTTMMALAHELTAAGKYAAILISMQVASVFKHDVEAAERVLLSNWRDRAEDNLPPDLRPPAWPTAETGQRINTALRAWAQAIPRPLVIFIDEIDALQDEALLSALHQLRDGYPQRPENFPAALALIGLRDVRDYKVASGGSERLGTASPFNIKVRSLTLDNFTATEVAALYQQHTGETGQVFTTEAKARAFELTQGQPYLANALAKVAVEELVTDPEQTVEVAHIDLAKEILIERQETHLDSLDERLREPRIRNIIEPILAGKSLADLPADDLRYVADLGLVRPSNGGGVVIANPIYREVIGARSHSDSRVTPKLFSRR